MAPASAPQRVKLVLRVHSAEQLQHSSSQGAYCKLYVGATAMTDGSHKALAKKDSGDSHSSEELDELQLEVRRTRTTHQQPNALAPPETIWDETFEVPMRPGTDVATQILSVRVKSQHLFFCPVIGACAVSLANLSVGERLEQWFPLSKGKKAAGRIRIMLLIIPDDQPLPVPRRKQPNQDVMAALAANHEADEAIKRLVDKQLREEAERRQKRLQKTASGPLVDVKRPPEATRDEGRRAGGNATWPPPPGVSSPKMLPPLGTPHREENQEESPSQQTPVSPMTEYERRLDRKLRQVQKETARLRKLKAQLKKYIPDLQTDSDSDDSLDSDEDPDVLTGSSASSLASTASASERHSSHSNKENHHHYNNDHRHSNELKHSRVKVPPEGAKLHDVLQVAKRCDSLTL